MTAVAGRRGSICTPIRDSLSKCRWTGLPPARASPSLLAGLVTFESNRSTSPWTGGVPHRPWPGG